MPGIWGWSRIDEDEYRANLNGLNTFFGAVIGCVLADVTTRNPLQFAQVLLVTSGVVVGILYVSASGRRWWYAALNLLIILALPRVVPPAEGDVTRFAIPKPEPLRTEHENFRDAVLGKDSDIVTMEQGARVVQVCEAMIESARTNQFIEIN